MPISFPPVVTVGVAKQIASNIREAILSGKLQVDQRLPTEDELAAAFGVSRPTIREALKRLAAQNLIRSQRGPSGGTFVTRPSQRELEDSLASATTLLASVEELDFADVLDARQALGMVCARLAAERRTAKDLEAIAAELATQGQPELADEDFCASDVRLHRAIVAATRSPLIQLVMTGIIHALQPVGNLMVFRVRERHYIRRQHEELFRAIDRQDGERAAEILAEQISYTRVIYCRVRHQRQERLVTKVSGAT